MATGEDRRVPDEKAMVRAVDETRAVAKRVVTSPAKAEKLVRNAERKAARHEGAVQRVYQYIQAFTRLLRAYVRREYPVIPWGSMILVTVALLYFVSPIDLIPDILPGGFIDDVALIASIVKQLQSDLEAFLAWETRDLSEEG